MTAVIVINVFTMLFVVADLVFRVWTWYIQKKKLSKVYPEMPEAKEGYSLNEEKIQELIDKAFNNHPEKEEIKKIFKELAKK